MIFKKDSFIYEFLQNFFLFVLLPYALLLTGVSVLAYTGISSAALAEISSYAYGFCGLSFIVITAGAFFLGASVMKPIKALSEMARELSKGNTGVKTEPARRDEIGELQKSFITFSKVFNEREKMKSTFSRYISDYIADEVLTENLGQALADYRNVTILFSDIRGFTTVSETIEPKDLFNILNMYFDQMIDIVLKNRGVINKFIGDAMMILYNAPTLCENAEIMAIITGLEMNRNLRDFNNKFTKKYGISIEIGIGINSGQVIAGNIGSEKRMEYTVIGDNVNVSSRLQTIAKGGEIVISESVARSAKYVFTLIDLGEIELKGKKQLIRVYRVGENLPYEKIKQNLTNADPVICHLSMIALGRIERLSLENDLMPLLKNGDEKIRTMALDLIVRNFKAKAEECIMFLLQNDKSEYVKTYAIDQIGKLNLVRFANFLTQQYLSTDSLRLRGATIDCLQSLNDEKIKDRIVKNCKFENPQISETVSRALNKYPALNVYASIEQMISDDSGEEEQKLGVYMLCQFGLSSKVDLLNKLFKECHNDEIRRLVVTSFLKIGNCRTVIFLLKNLNGFEKETLNNAYKVIAHLISKFHESDYKYDISVQIQLDIIKSIILSSEGKNFEKLKVALIKNK